MRLLLAILIASFASFANAQVTCRPVEYAELKEMPVFDLSWKYCDALQKLEWAKKQTYGQVISACLTEIGRMTNIFEVRGLQKPESCEPKELIKLRKQQ